jgi:peptidoglycan/xylan/chitin deacetylase (PgdA/CDA1 family)
MVSEMDLQQLAKTLCRDRRTLEMFRYLVNNAFIRTVNYHTTDRKDAGRIEYQVKYFAEHFAPVSLIDVDEFFETGKWNKKKPGLICCAYEGYRGQYDVLAPILNKYGFRGWFFIPGFFPDVPPPEQEEYSVKNDLETPDSVYYPDGRIAMNRDEIAGLAECHEICCHTGNHFRITKDTSELDMNNEIVDAKRNLEGMIGRSVDVFCWLYGEEYNHNVRAHPFFEAAGYRYVMSNLKIEKIG